MMHLLHRACVLSRTVLVFLQMRKVPAPFLPSCTVVSVVPILPRDNASEIKKLKKKLVEERQVKLSVQENTKY